MAPIVHQWPLVLACVLPPPWLATASPGTSHGASLTFEPPVLVARAGPKAFGYADQGFAVDEAHIWAPREAEGGPPWSNAPEIYVTNDAGARWQPAPSGMPFMGSPIVIRVDDRPGAPFPVRDLGQRFGWEVAQYGVGKRVSRFTPKQNYTTYFGVANGKWQWKRVNESVVFDLSPHVAWETNLMEGLFAFNLAQCDSIKLPDGSMLVTAQVQWGQGNISPRATKTAPVSLVVFRAEEPFLYWKFHGVVANASQYPTGFHGYGEGANENSITMLPPDSAGGDPVLLVVFRDDDQLGQFNTDSETAHCTLHTANLTGLTHGARHAVCNYTSVRSTDWGRTWGEPRVLPAGTVDPVLASLHGGRFHVLSGGRENAAPGKAMAGPGCRTAWEPHCGNNDVVLWLAPTDALLCGTNCSDDWRKYSISSIHNRLLPPTFGVCTLSLSLRLSLSLSLSLSLPLSLPLSLSLSLALVLALALALTLSLPLSLTLPLPLSLLCLCLCLCRQSYGSPPKSIRLDTRRLRTRLCTLSLPTLSSCSTILRPPGSVRTI